MIFTYKVAVCRILAGTCVAAVLAAGTVGLPDVTPAAKASAPVTLAAETSPLNVTNDFYPSFCIFGKHKGKKGCRGGGINNNKDLNESAKVTGKCTGKALGGGLLGKLKKRKRPKASDLPLPNGPLTGARIIGCTVFTPEPAR